MMVPPETGASVGAGEMPTREMNAQYQPGGTGSPLLNAAAVAPSAGEMPMREMNAAAAQPLGRAQVDTAHEREKLDAYVRDRQDREAANGSASAGDLATREMNAQSRPGGTSSPPTSAAAAAGASEMPMREMNAEPQQLRGGATIETPHEREKLAAHLRDPQDPRNSSVSARASEMPTREMNAAAQAPGPAAGDARAGCGCRGSR